MGQEKETILVEVRDNVPSANPEEFLARYDRVRDTKGDQNTDGNTSDLF